MAEVRIWLSDDATYTVYGVYLQDDISLGALDITGGIRYTGIHARASTQSKKRAVYQPQAADRG